MRRTWKHLDGGENQGIRMTRIIHLVLIRATANLCSYERVRRSRFRPLPMGPRLGFPALGIHDQGIVGQHPMRAGGEFPNQEAGGAGAFLREPDFA